VAALRTPMPTPLDSGATQQPAPARSPTPPLLTPIDALGKTGSPVQVDIATYRLTVDGLVEHPLSLSYDEILALSAVTQVVRLECPGFFVDYAEWSGPLVSTLLAKAGIKPDASEVEFSDGAEYPYRSRLTLEEALWNDTFVAHKVNGQILPVEHGYPLRLVAGGKLGSVWVKWLFHIEVK
jgi:DMSO/TMAO reductase YedYZ molybdopterin-dependent catalytic subunit